MEQVLFDPVTLGSFVVKLLRLLIALAAAVYFSRWLDKRLGHRFAVHLEIIRASRLGTALYFGLRWIGICYVVGSALALALLVGTIAPASAASPFPDEYDGEIREAVATYWPDYPDWLAWKAQLYQESRLDPSAVSPAGAAGLAQFMPATWREIGRALGWGTLDRSLAEPAIQGGAYYMARLRAQWRSPRPPAERQRLAQASYNAGLGNILGAQRGCGGARFWAAIAPCLRAVTGARNAAETIGYVERIARWRALMEAGL